MERYKSREEDFMKHTMYKPLAVGMQLPGRMDAEVPGLKWSNSNCEVFKDHLTMVRRISDVRCLL